MKVTNRFKTFVPNDVPSQCFDHVNRNEPTIIQIGAHEGSLGEEYGFHEFLFELEKCQVHLIEPLLKYYEQLPNVYEKYSNENKIIKYHNFAISDKNEDLHMVDLGGYSHFISSEDDKSIVVKAKTWNDFIQENSIEKLDLLLIDCEGFEFEIIKQIFETSSVHPKVIRYEYFHISNKKEIDDFLRNHGYFVFLCETDPSYNKIATI